MNEKKLIEGCLQQKRDAQKLLYDTYSKQMYSICLRYHKDRDLANESLQRGFIKVFKQLNTYKYTGSLGGWIRSIIVRTSIDVLNEQTKLRFDEVDALEDHSSNIQPYDHKLDSIDYSALLQILDELPIGYRTVFSMYVLDDLKHNEIASILKISVNTSRSQFHKARKLLKEIVIKRFGKVKLENF